MIGSIMFLIYVLIATNSIKILWDVLICLVKKCVYEGIFLIYVVETHL